MKNCKSLLKYLTIVLVAGFTLRYGSPALAQCTNDLAIPSSLFGAGFNGNGNFNVVVLGDYEAVTGISEGRLAVGGNFTLNSPNQGFTVGVGADAPATSDNFIVQGTYTNMSGQVASLKGNFFYGSLGTFTPPPTVTPPGTVNNLANRLNFSGMQSHYNTLSAGYESQPASSSPDPIVSGSTLTLTGDNTVKNYVFNVTVTTNTITGIDFVNIPAGSGILINILNTNVSFASGGTSMVATFKEKTLLNFPNAQAILLNGFTLEGGILAPNANLSATGNASAINGPVVIGGDINQTGTLNFNNTCFTYPLPVRLAEFKVKKEGAITDLAWKTSSESNADRFTVERRNQQSSWSAIGDVAAKGTSNEVERYTFTDRSPLNGVNLYRLKMTDLDGTYAYSSIVSADFNFNHEPLLRPNPATDYITFSDWSKVANVKVLNQKGNLILTNKEKEEKLDIRSLSSGLYLLRITATDGSVSTRRFIKK